MIICPHCYKIRPLSRGQSRKQGFFFWKIEDTKISWPLLPFTKMIWKKGPTCFANFNRARLLIHPCGVEGAHDFLGNSANTDSKRQQRGNCGTPRYPLLPMKQTKLILIWKLNGIYYSVFLFWLQTQQREKFDYAVTIFTYNFLLLHLTPMNHETFAISIDPLIQLTKMSRLKLVILILLILIWMPDLRF